MLFHFRDHARSSVLLPMMMMLLILAWGPAAMGFATVSGFTVTSKQVANTITTCTTGSRMITAGRHRRRRPYSARPSSSSRQELCMIASPLLQGEGSPSKPGWTSGRLERLSEWANAREANRDIIGQYKPEGFWLWTRFRGTVFKLTWGSVVGSMLASLMIDLIFRSVTTAPAWDLLSIPPATEPFIKSLKGFETMWAYQLSLCSLVLTFFTSLAFSYWQKVYNTTRMIQGRINDFCMLLTMSAARMDITPDMYDEDDNNAPSTYASSVYTPQSLKLATTITRLLRMSHTFFWAATPTLSNGLSDSSEFMEESENCHIPIDDNHIGPIMMSRYGLKALAESNQLTKQEVKALLRTGLPPSQYPFVLLEWVGILVMQGLHDKKASFVGGPGLEQNLLQQLTSLRASMFDIDDMRAGRMPLAYVQLVQVLVDSLIMLAPFALYPELGTLSVPLSGVLALFFRGLLALSKSFLDPFGVEGFDAQNMKVDVLVSELNFGASKRWLQAGAFLPKDNDRKANGSISTWKTSTTHSHQDMFHTNGAIS